MGWQIGLMCARAGYAVHQNDVRPEALEQARERQRATLEEWHARGELGRLKATGEPPEAVLARITYHTSLDEAGREADFAIEAATEKLEVKRRIFADLSRVARPDTILATNSSSIMSRRLVDAVTDPGRLCNFHFCNHPWLRPYVETMSCGETRADVLETCQRFGRSLGIASAMVHGEVQGFIHNYVWRHVKKAAMTLVDEGHASVEDVDRAVMIGLRCPLGPFQMMDRAGLDVMLDIERQWHAESGDPRDAPPKVLEELVARGDLGVKTGRGFYSYPDPAFERPGWLFGQDAPPGP
jgi:3-hydroxybutyryl-CoA dehydrogenase